MELERLEKIKDILELKDLNNFEPNHDQKQVLTNQQPANRGKKINAGQKLCQDKNYCRTKTNTGQKLMHTGQKKIRSAPRKMRFQQ